MKKPALALALLLVLGACADGTTSTETTNPPDTTTTTLAPATTAIADTTVPEDTTTTTEATTTAAPEDANDNIATAETSLGPILVNGEGMTLYILATDGAESTCYEGCVSTWPIVTAGATAAEGLDVTLGSAARTDGSEQLTINGQPVYLYVGDSAPGDVNGQGLFDIWFVLDANGEPVT